MILANLIAESGLVAILRGELLTVTKERTLWKATIKHVLIEYNI